MCVPLLCLQKQHTTDPYALSVFALLLSARRSCSLAVVKNVVFSLHSSRCHIAQALGAGHPFFSRSISLLLSDHHHLTASRLNILQHLLSCVTFDTHQHSKLTMAQPQTVQPSTMQMPPQAVPEMPPSSYYPDPPNDLTGGLPINLDSLRDGPPGSKPFYPYSTLIRYVF